MNEHAQEIAVKSATALFIAGLLALIPALWNRFKSWRDAPTLSAAIGKLTETLDGLKRVVDNLAHQMNGTSDAITVMNANIRLVMDADKTPRWWTDKNGHCKEVNKAICALFKMSREEMLADNGRGWLRRVHEARRPEVLRTFLASLTEGVPYSCTYPLDYGDGSELVTCIANGDTVKDAAGNILTVFGTVHPLEPLKAA